MSKASTPSPVRTPESSARCMVCAVTFRQGRLTHWRVLTTMFILFAGALGLIHRVAVDYLANALRKHANNIVGVHVRQSAQTLHHKPGCLCFV